MAGGTLTVIRRFAEILNVINNNEMYANENSDRVKNAKAFMENKIKKAQELITDQKALEAYIAFEKNRFEMIKNSSLDVANENIRKDGKILNMVSEAEALTDYYDFRNEEWEHYKPVEESDYTTLIGFAHYIPRVSPLSTYKENYIFKKDYFNIPYISEEKTPILLYADSDRDTTGSVCEVFCNIAMRWLRDMENKTAHVIVIDPVNRGTHLGNMMKLIGNNDLDICRYYKNEDEISAELIKLTDYVDEVCAILTKEGYNNIYEYNEANGEKKIPYKMLIINDYPVGLKQEGLRNLNIIISKARQCGVSVLISHKSKDAMSTGNYDNTAQTTYEEYIDKFLKIQYVDNNAYIIIKGKQYEFENLDAPVSTEFINEMREEFSKRPVIKSDFTQFFDKDYIEMYREISGSSANGISIPFAVDESGEQVMLNLDSDTSTFGFISGIPGSGKTTLLHMIINSAMMNYSPEELELWLIDYKSTEFRSYATVNQAPHIRYIIADDSDEISYDFIRLLKEEYKRRKNLFNEAGVNKFSAYRAAGYKLSRLLVIVDESHRLAEAAQMDGNCQKDIHDLYAEVRAVGINILLSDQYESSSFKGFTPETKESVSVRIAMKSSKEQIQATLGLEYNSVHFTDKLKEDIANTSIGSQGMLIYKKEEHYPDGRNEVNFIAAKSIYMNESSKNDIISRIKEIDSSYTKVQDYYLGGDRVPMDMSKIQDFEKVNPVMDDKDRFYVGTPQGIQYGFYMNVDNAESENVLIAGTDKELKAAILKSIIASGVRNGYKIVLLGWQKTAFYKQYKDIFESNSDKNIESISKYVDICKYICMETVKIENLMDSYDDDDEDEDEENSDTKTIVIIPELEELWKKFKGDGRRRRDVISAYTGETAKEAANTVNTSANDVKKEFEDMPEEFYQLLQMGMEAGLADTQDYENLSKKESESTDEKTDNNQNTADGTEDKGNKIPGYNATEDLEKLITIGHSNKLHMVCMIDSGMFAKQQRFFENSFNHRIAVPNMIEASSVIAHPRALTALVDKNETNKAIYEYMGGRAQIFRPYIF